MRQRGKVLSRGRWQQRPNMAAVADQAWIWTPSQLSPSLMTPYPAYPWYQVLENKETLIFLLWTTLCKKCNHLLSLCKRDTSPQNVETSNKSESPFTDAWCPSNQVYYIISKVNLSKKLQTSNGIKYFVLTSDFIFFVIKETLKVFLQEVVFSFPNFPHDRLIELESVTKSDTRLVRGESLRRLSTTSREEMESFWWSWPWMCSAYDDIVILSDHMNVSSIPIQLFNTFSGQRYLKTVTYFVPNLCFPAHVSMK